MDSGYPPGGGRRIPLLIHGGPTGSFLKFHIPLLPGVSAAMASRFLRADWHRACRLAKPQGSVGGSTLSLSREAGSGDPPSSASSPLRRAELCVTASPGWHHHSTSGKHLLGRACSTFSASSRGSADALGFFAAGLRYDGCWRGGWKGGLCSTYLVTRDSSWQGEGSC